MTFNKFLAVLGLICLYSSPLLGATYDVSIAPGNNFDKAQFRLWVDDSTENFKGVLVLNPGSNSDGRENVNESAWQDFAVQHDFALVATYWTDHPHDNMVIEKYVEVSRGSGDALLQALKQLATDTNHRELADAPLLFWGMSAGGEYNYEFALWKPDRTIAFVVNKGGIYYSVLASKEARQVPGLFFIGENDLKFRTEVLNGIFSVNRRVGALWTLSVEPGVGHELGMSKEMALTYYNEIVPLRLAGTQPSTSGKVDLHPLTEDIGRLGIFATLDVQAVSPEAKKEPTAWLPTQKTGEAWQAISAGKSW
jgi:hypothetical protein